MLLGIIIGVCVMSVFGCIGAWAIENDKEELGILTLGPAAWLSWIGYGILAYLLLIIKPKRITKERLEELPHFYKMVGKKWCLCRWYAHKEDHPIRYHIKFLMRVEIIDKPERIR